MSKTPDTPESQSRSEHWSDRGTHGTPSAQLVTYLAKLPWWLLIIMLFGLMMVFLINTNEDYNRIFDFLKEGIIVTLRVTLTAYAIAVTIGLFAGLGRVSKNPIIYNIATLYVQVMRGIPILVTIMYVTYVIPPYLVDFINAIGEQLVTFNILPAENWFTTFTIRDFLDEHRAIFALAFSYGAFSAEVFRAGIESIGRGQMEAARSLGMSYIQAMRYIILPQAVRRVLPPLGNDLIAMLKESSLISVIGIREITRLTTIETSRSFLYLKGYNILAFMYLSMTILLSLGVKGMERRLKIDD